MKHILLAFVCAFGIFSFLRMDGVVFAEGGYDLESAWGDLGLESQLPQHLVGAGEIKATGDSEDVTKLGVRFTKGLLSLATTLAVFFIVYVSLNFVTSAGNSDAISKGKKAFTWMALGLLLITFAYVIVKTIISLPFSGS